MMEVNKKNNEPFRIFSIMPRCRRRRKNVIENGPRLSRRLRSECTK